MTQLIALFRLDLRLFFHDRRALILIFAVPIGIASFMGSITGGSNQGGRNAPAGMQLLITDLDNSPISREVIRGFAQDSNFQVTVTNAEAARDLVLNGRRPVALVLPSGFGAQALPGLFDARQKPAITVYHDPSRGTERQVVEGMLVPKVLSAVAQNAVTPDSARTLLRQGLENLEGSTGLEPRERELLRELIHRTQQWIDLNTPTNRATPSTSEPFELPLPFTLQSQALTRNEAVYNGYAHSFAGMGLQFVLMAMIDFAVGLLKERESGVFRRLRAAPLSRATLLAGKAAAWSAIAFLSLAGCFAFSMLVFRVRVEGSWPGFIGVLVASSILAGTLGLMLAAVGRTPAGTRGVSIAVMLLLVMVGGAWFPSFLFPQWLQSVSRMTPTRWAMDGLDGMTWRGLGWEAALGPIGILLAFSVAFSAVTWWKFRWEAR